MANEVSVKQQDKQDKIHPIVVLRERLESRKSELRAALPSDISADRFIRALITSAQINPDILACTWNSVWLACMRACRDGLLPDGVEGAIVPYKDKATWIPMYRGLLRKFQQSGSFKWVTANVVYEGEEFKHWIDEHGEHIRHTPSDRFEMPIEKVYAMATTKDGGVFITVMPIAEINKIRKFSRASREDAPWNQWPTEMMRKTALRRLSKMLPSAPIPEEEELEEQAPDLRLAASTEPRTTGAAAALDAFASTSSPASSVDDTGETSGGAQQPSSDEQSVRSHAHEAEEAAAAADAERKKNQNANSQQDDDPITTAYHRGQEAKKAGHARKALPGEYRDSARDREADAWLNGYDGGPM